MTNQAGTSDTNTYQYQLKRFERYRESTVEGSKNNNAPGRTTSQYDPNGNLISIADSTKAENNRVFVNDASGRALYVNQNGHVQRQLIVNEESMGRYGDMVDSKTPKDANGNPNYTARADFNFGYQPVDGNYPSPSPGVMTVSAGDTLASIAKSAYGDANLWYLIADANGIGSDQDLRVGQALTIPNRVGSAGNNAHTFKPYDPSKVLGDTTPNLPEPSRGGKGGCGGLGKVLMLVVAVVATIYTAGAAAAFFGAAGTAGGFAGGLAVLGGTATIGIPGSMAIAAGAAAVGSAASQLLGMATGDVESFSWKQVGLAAVSGGVGAGVGALAGGVPVGDWTAAAGRAAVGERPGSGLPSCIDGQSSATY